VELFLRFSATVIVLFGLFAGIAYFGSDLLAPLGLDVGSFPATGQLMDREIIRRHKLRQELEQVHFEEDGKNAILRDLIEGRIDLLEATAAISDGCNLSQVRLALGGLEVQGRTEDERLCRLVIYWTQALLDDCPEKAVMVRQRLQGQLDRQLQQHGPIVLHGKFVP
jgi:hypothetical protein